MAVHEELVHVLKGCMMSTKVFAKVFMPERFNRDFSTLHSSLFDLLDSATAQKVAIAAPRGLGKTSIVNIAYPLRNIAFGLSDFIIPCSLSETAAVGHAEDLKKEIEGNELMLKVFGNLKGKNWSKELYETKNGVRVFPRGAGQQIRGHLYKGKRPNRIILDDIEDAKEVMSETNRLGKYKWFNSDVCNAIDRSSKSWRILLIGTVLHHASVLQRCLEDPSWHSIRLEICDDNLQSNDENYISTADVKKLVEEHRVNGLLDEFFMEYRNLCVSTEGALFTREMFKYYEESDLLKDDNIINVMLIDPAKTVNATSCDSAIVIVGLDLINHKIYQREVDAGKYTPNDTIHKALDLAVKYNVSVCGLEITGLNDYITHPFKSEMTRRGQSMEVIELNPRGDKMDRIAGLSPYYKQGLIYHNKSTSAGLETQLLMHPKPKKADIMDAFSHIVQVMAEGNKYFSAFQGSSKVKLEEQYSRMRRNYKQSSDSWRFI